MPPFPSTVPLSRPNRRFSQGHIPQPVYLGLDVVVSPERDESHYTISVHDGSYTTDYYFGRLWEHPKGMSRADCIKDALSKLGDVVQMYALAQDCKVQLVACSYWVADQTIKDEERPARSSMSAFWRDLDALPFVVETHGETSDERASAAVRKSVMWLTPGNPGNLPRVFVGFRHEVEVDFNYQIHMVDLLDYKTTVCDETWRVFQEMVKTFKERNLRVSFFSSTPQGGGVALMRHALLRFLHLNGVDVHWYVARPKPEIFDITKRKFHNVMQGVAPEGVCLSEADEQAFVDWSEENVNRFWLDSKGPIKDSDVVVIDDPQVTGIIPLIRKYAPETKIIFRSHIEMRADLIRQHPNGPQARTWSFLWNFIKEADLFIAHPVENFIPDQVPRHTVVLMPACTDPLDGLNKRLPEWCGQYYQRVFNRVCLDQGAQEVDWTRPYIVQVARFDPSKGIPDCLEAYRRLRLKLAEEDYDPDQTPQLVICGHGSIDDPEGTVIYEHTHAQLADPNFAPLAKDIIVARLPPSDQLLNVILRNARVALQLSYREGFEVKVTEALHKGVPVVAYEAGGIPLQIQGDKNGFLIPVGEIDTVMEKLYSLVVDDDLHARMSEAARTGVTEEYFTVWNTMNWLHLWIELTNKRGVNSEGLDGELDTLKANSGVGGSKKASALWQAKYNYNPSVTSKQ